MSTYNPRTDGGGSGGMAGNNDMPSGDGKYGQNVRGYRDAPAKSVRPARRPLPSDLSDLTSISLPDASLPEYTTGTDWAISDGDEIKKPASPPSLAPVPRGYIHAEASFQPTTTDETHGRITKRKV